jgi:hypothetical protein
MYGESDFAVAVILAVVMVALPVIWVAWWLLADLGEGMADSAAHIVREVPVRRHRPAA